MDLVRFLGRRGRRRKFGYSSARSAAVFHGGAFILQFHRGLVESESAWDAAINDVDLLFNLGGRSAQQVRTLAVIDASDRIGRFPKSVADSRCDWGRLRWQIPGLREKEAHDLMVSAVMTAHNADVPELQEPSPHAFELHNLAAPIGLRTRDLSETVERSYHQIACLNADLDIQQESDPFLGLDPDAQRVLGYLFLSKSFTASEKNTAKQIAIALAEKFGRTLPTVITTSEANKTTKAIKKVRKGLISSRRGMSGGYWLAEPGITFMRAAISRNAFKLDRDKPF